MSPPNPSNGSPKNSMSSITISNPVNTASLITAFDPPTAAYTGPILDEGGAAMTDEGGTPLQTEGT